MALRMFLPLQIIYSFSAIPAVNTNVHEVQSARSSCIENIIYKSRVRYELVATPNTREVKVLMGA